MIEIEQKYKDRYFLNSDSLFSEFGVIIEKGGYKELLKEPQRKQGYVNDWTDENGIERFIEPYFDTRNVSLNFVFICETLEDYLTKRENLYNILKAGSYVVLTSTTLNRSWELLYNNTSSVEDLTDIYKGGLVTSRHTINFLDDKTKGDFFNGQAFLTDENGIFLTNENDEYLTINL